MEEEIPTVLSSTAVYKGRVFSVRTDEIGFAGEKPHRVDIVEHGGSFAIIATTADDAVVLVRQYRHAVNRYLWEIPAGTAEPNEDPIAGAARELAEETGYRAISFRRVGCALMTPGFCDEMIHFVHATGLSEGAQQLDEDEHITVASFTLEDARRLVQAGEISDAKTLLALMWLAGDRAEFVPASADN